jgi:hypothetical protein
MLDGEDVPKLAGAEKCLGQEVAPTEDDGISHAF